MRPSVRNAPPHSTTANRIPLHVDHRRPEVFLVQRAGEEAVLPEMAAPAVKAIDVASVVQVRSPHSLGQRLRLPGRGDQMHVVGHQAIAVDGQAELLGLLSQYVKIVDAVLIDEEDILAIVPPLGHVMRTTRNDNSRRPWHRGIVIKGHLRIN